MSKHIHTWTVEDAKLLADCHKNGIRNHRMIFELTGITTPGINSITCKKYKLRQYYDYYLGHDSDSIFVKETITYIDKQLQQEKEEKLKRKKEQINLKIKHVASVYAIAEMSVEKVFGVIQTVHPELNIKKGFVDSCIRGTHSYKMWDYISEADLFDDYDEVVKETMKIEQVSIGISKKEDISFVQRLLKHEFSLDSVVTKAETDALCCVRAKDKVSPKTWTAIYTRLIEEGVI